MVSNKDIIPITFSSNNHVSCGLHDMHINFCIPHVPVGKSTAYVYTTVSNKMYKSSKSLNKELHSQQSFLSLFILSRNLSSIFHFNMYELVNL